MAERLVGGEGFATDASLIKADVNKQRSAAAGEDVDWEGITATRRSVREYLETLDDAAWGAASEVEPKFVSRSDPAAQWTGAHKGHAFFAYATNYLIDLDHAVAVIVDVEASRDPPGRGRRRPHDDRAHPGPLRSLARQAGGRQRLRFGRKPRLAGPRARITPHIPIIDGSHRQGGTFERADFAFDHAADTYTCPAGKPLRSRQKTYQKPLADEDGMVRYRAQPVRLRAMPTEPRCCPKAPARKILRSIHEGARDTARDLATTAAYVTSRREREKVEMLFAHLNRILRLDRLRLRGPNGARDEFLLAATARKLRKMAKLIPFAPQAAPA